MIRMIKRMGVTMLFVLLPAARAFAQQAEGAAEEQAGKSYILAYVLVLLVVVLGVVAACRPSGRKDRPKMVERDLESTIDPLSGMTK